MTSAQLARVMNAASRRWFDTVLRRRLDDGDRIEWHDKFVARAVSLIAFWSRPKVHR